MKINFDIKGIYVVKTISSRPVFNGKSHVWGGEGKEDVDVNEGN